MPALRAISRLAEVAARAADADPIYAEALDVLLEALGADRAAVLLFEADGVLRFKAWRHLSDTYRASVEGHSPWEAGEPDPRPVLVPDVAADPGLAHLLPVLRGEGIGAVAFLPLLITGRLLGKFMVYFDAPHAFSDAELELAQAIAAQVAFAIDRHRLEAELRLANRTLAATLDAAADGITAQGPDGRLLFANDDAAAMLGFDSPADLLGADPAVIMERFEVFSEDGQPIPLSDLPGRQALAGREPPEVLVRWRRRGQPDDRWSLVSSRPVRAEDGSVRFAVNVFRDMTERQRAAESLLDSERRMAFLASVSPQLLGSTLDYGTVLDRVADLFVPELADACTVRELCADGSIRRVAARHSGAFPAGALDQLDGATDPLSSPVLLKRLEAGDALLLPSPSHGSEDEASARLPGLESAMIVPLTSGDTLVGALTLMTLQGGRRYCEADVALVDEVAHRAALAVENARLFAQRSTVAATLQRALLPPQLPAIPGVELAARYHAAASEIGGDFYDMVPVGPDQWLIVLGDVCGKGIEAASLTAMVRYTLRAFAPEAGRPSELLRRLNDALLRQLSPERFCTVACALLEVGGEAIRVTLSLGGHPRPLLVAANGSVRPVGLPGTLLGSLPEPSLSDEHVALGPGDALVLFTDGCLAEGSADPAEAALAGVLRRAAGGGAADLAEAVDRAADANDHIDDVTVLACRRLDA